MRIKDPAGLLPDHVSVDPDDPVSVFKLLKGLSPASRIEQLRRHEALAEKADELLSLLDESGSASMYLMNLIASAERDALYLDAAPRVERDNKRQDGTKKERRPKINEWIRNQLRSNPDAKSPNLWSDAPDWITDQIGYNRFTKRVTGCRKELKIK